MVPSAITYSALISACKEGKQPERALQVLEAIKQRGAVSDAITYNALICACEKGKQPEQALQVFEAMQQ